MGAGARLWLGVFALGIGWAVGTSAQAAAVPAFLTLRTSVSADGTAVVTFEGIAAEYCETTAATISGARAPGVLLAGLALAAYVRRWRRRADRKVG